MHSDQNRRELGFLTVAETDELNLTGVRVLDPHSTLVGRGVVIAETTVLYPTVVIRSDRAGAVVIGAGCVLYPGSVIEAEAGGRVTIGNRCELGPNGVLIRAEGSKGSVALGDEVRLSGGCELSGACELGHGAQILGAVTARSVNLGAGKGGYRWPVADERGAVLKGTGMADGTVLTQGQVKSCRPSFEVAPPEWQSAYHPETR